MCSQIYSNIIQVFTLFMKAIFPRSDTRPTQVGDMHPWPVTWPNLSNLIGWGQKISSTSWQNIGIDTNIEVIAVSLTTWEAHQSPRAVVTFPGR